MILLLFQNQNFLELFSPFTGAPFCINLCLYIGRGFAIAGNGKQWQPLLFYPPIGRIIIRQSRYSEVIKLQTAAFRTFPDYKPTYLVVLYLVE